MIAEHLLRKKCADNLQVVKVAPPSLLCKRLWQKTNHREMAGIRAVALTTFGIVGAKAANMLRQLKSGLLTAGCNNSRRPRSLSNGGVAWLLPT